MNQLENVTLDKSNPAFHTDIPRLKQGRVGAQVRGLGRVSEKAEENSISSLRQISAFCATAHPFFPVATFMLLFLIANLGTIKIK